MWPAGLQKRGAVGEPERDAECHTLTASLPPSKSELESIGPRVGLFRWRLLKPPSQPFGARGQPRSVERELTWRASPATPVPTPKVRE